MNNKKNTARQILSGWLDRPFIHRHPNLVLGAVALAVVWIAWSLLKAEENASYLTLSAERGDIVSVITATGVLTPVGQVNVGSQLSGQVAEVLVDFNDQVSAGQPLARLDPQGYEAIVREAEAALEIAEAGMLVQEAALDKAESDLATARASQEVGAAETDSMRAQREEAERTLERLRTLEQEAAISGSEVDRAEARAETTAALLRASETQEQVRDATTRSAAAAVNMALAQLQNAIGEVKRMTAILERANVDLARTTIAAPIDGVVIGRNVDSGQTVAATLEAPTLFTLAKDLRDMEVHAQIDQADIGRIRVGQAVRFSVDAFPDRDFVGAVTQIRKAPQVFQNVVTYQVIVSADNAEGLLLPGMTAVLRITVAEVHDVLKVPAAALRFRPAESIAGPVEAMWVGRELARPERGRAAVIWVLSGGEIAHRVIGYEEGDTDSVAVVGGNLERGELVVIGTAAAEDSPVGLRLGF